MSTRGCLGIVKNGELKVAQFISCDAYPGGAGQEIIEFFKGKGLDYKNNSHSFQILSEKIDDLKFMTDEEFKEIEEAYGHDSRLTDNFKYLYSGTDILNWLYNDGYYIYNGYDNNTGEPYEEKIGNGEMKLKLHSDFFGDSLFCEWGYIIDIDKKTFEVYKGFNTKPLSPEDRFYYLQEDDKEYKPVKIVTQYNFDELPSRITISKELLDDE
jgi:hypothetical protein